MYEIYFAAVKPYLEERVAEAKENKSDLPISTKDLSEIIKDSLSTELSNQQLCRLFNYIKRYNLVENLFSNKMPGGPWYILGNPSSASSYVETERIKFKQKVSAKESYVAQAYNEYDTNQEESEAFSLVQNGF